MEFTRALLLLTVSVTSALQQTNEGNGSVFFTFTHPHQPRGVSIVYRPHNSLFYSPGDEVTACIHLGIAFPDRPSEFVYNYTVSQWSNIHILDWSEKGKYYYLSQSHLDLIPGRTSVYDIRLYNNSYYGRWRCWWEWKKKTPFYSDLNRYYRVPETVRYCRVESKSSPSSLNSTPCSAVLNGTSSGDLQNKFQQISPDSNPKALKYLLYHGVAVAAGAVGCIGICVILTYICKKRHQRQRCASPTSVVPPQVTGSNEPFSGQLPLDGGETGTVGWNLLVLPEYKDVPAADPPPAYEESCKPPETAT